MLPKHVALCICASLLSACSATARSPDAGGPVGGADAGSSVDAGNTSDAGIIADSGTPLDASVDRGAVPVVTLVRDSGGPKLGSPHVQLIGYSADSDLPSLAAFITSYGASDTWATQMTEYGVGPLSLDGTVGLTGTAPLHITDAYVQSWIASSIATPGSGWAPADSGTVYVLYFPQQTTIAAEGQTSCKDFDGYHSETTVDGTPVSYVVIPTCGVPPDSMLSQYQSATLSISHEIMETCTDPFPDTNPAYKAPDDASAVWIEYTGGELADMCELLPNAGFVTDAGYTVQRVWSNTQAAAGNDPCVPGQSTPYVNAYALASDPLTWTTPDDGTFSTIGVNVAIGQTVSVPVRLYSNVPNAGPWTVRAYELPTALDGGTGVLTLSLDPGSGVSGGELTLSITRNGTGSAEAVLLESTLAGQAQFTLVAVGP